MAFLLLLFVEPGYMSKQSGLLLKLVVTVVLLPALAGAADIDPSILICRQVQPVYKRAQCYDQAVDRLLGKDMSNAPVVIPSMSNQDTRGVEDNTRQKPSVTPETVFGKSERETTRILLQEKTNQQDIDSMVSRVVDVKRDRLGKLTIVLDNKQVWRQTDSTDLILHTGDEIRILRGVLNSFQLEKNSGSRRIRVKRID